LPSDPNHCRELLHYVDARRATLRSGATRLHDSLLSVSF
jgi:hypothetical protein